MKGILRVGRRYVWIGGLLLVIGAVAWLLWPKPVATGACKRGRRGRPATPDTAGFTRIEGPRPLIFPADHGPHDDTQTEWWYYTGNLTAESGEHFGYQGTLSRRALDVPNQRVERESRVERGSGLTWLTLPSQMWRVASTTRPNALPAARPVGRRSGAKSCVAR